MSDFEEGAVPGAVPGVVPGAVSSANAPEKKDKIEKSVKRPCQKGVCLTAI
jgi:hypothetical protein